MDHADPVQAVRLRYIAMSRAVNQLIVIKKAVL
jgi:hypothetical protein